MSGLALLGIVVRQRPDTSFDREPVMASTFSASSRMVNSPGLPILIGPVTSSGVAISRIDAVDQIVDIAERARLLAVAVDRDVLAAQAWHDEIGHHAAVVGVHARAVGVEDAHHLDAQPVLAAIVEKQRFGAALALVVAGARPDRIDVAPVFFGLRMHGGIAIDLRGRGLQDLGPSALGEAEHVDRADDAGLGRLHRIELIMDRRGRAGEIVDLVDLDIERKRDVVAQQLEMRIVEQIAMLCARPVKKLSTQRTSWPCLKSRRQRCEPRKPAPPVTRTRF